MKTSFAAGASPTRRAVLLVVAALTLSGCAGLGRGLETPNVTVSSFRALPSESMMPAFEIGLRIINPNGVALNLRGVSYTVSLEGNEVIKGVANDLPVIDAYGEGEIKLTAAANLFAGMRLISDLLRANKDTFDYSFEARLDVGRLLPDIRVTDAGSISLRGATGI
jgi:LEA14-like dessication related protein